MASQCGEPKSEELVDILNGMPDPRQTNFTDLWEGFLSKILLSSSDICAAGIFLMEDGKLLAKSSNFHMRAEELCDIVNNFDDLDLLYNKGITINEENFKVRLADGRFGIFARTGLRGCSVSKTFTLLIVALHHEKGKAAKCNELVMSVGDYFFKKGL